MLRLARTVRDGDDRDSTLAAKTLEGFLGKQKELGPVAELTDQELRQRLAEALLVCGDHVALIIEELPDSERWGSAAAPVPDEGSGVVAPPLDAEIIDSSDSGGGAGTVSSSQKSETPKTQA